MPTNFLWSTGTNGLISTAPLTLMSTELASLAASTIASNGIAVSVGLSSGFAFSTDTKQAVFGYLQYVMGSPGSSVNAMGAGSNLSGWFLVSIDGGVTMESSLAAPPRPPDFIIPFPVTTIAPSTSIPYQASGLVRLPPTPFRTLIQNNSTNTLGGSSIAGSLKVAPVALQY